MSFELPARGLAFWPVGNGDSTTIAIDADNFLQVDLNHLETKADDEDDAAWAVIDELVERLPKVSGRPYLAAFVLTHPDQDHCRGFDRLLEEVDIGELWFTPRVFAEYNKDLCDDAEAFKKEAKRRVAATVKVKGDPDTGDRVRIFGYSDLLEEDEFKDFPEDRITVPGNELSEVDGNDLSDVFRAFIHAPFKDDDAGDRNDTSLAMQVTLRNGDKTLRAMLFGDLSYPILKRIFDKSDADDLAWNLLLVPHHCSKAAMYWQDEGDEKEEFKQGIMNSMDDASLQPNRSVSSSNPVPSSNKSGDNPPHAKAKTQYELITDSFLCTMDQDEPIVAELTDSGIVLAGAAAAAKTATEAANQARGRQEPPGGAHTYGSD